jgi:hypothetical protein
MHCCPLATRWETRLYGAALVWIFIEMSLRKVEIGKQLLEKRFEVGRCGHYLV